MTVKADFTTEEWTQLIQAPGAAGLYVMMSDPSFVVGSMKEAFAVSSSILEKAKQSNSELLTELLADYQNKEEVKKAQIKFEKKDIETIKKTAFEVLEQVTRILDDKATPDESAEIRNWLYAISVKTANAAKEGGFLGFGGERVSTDEQAALRKIAWKLGVKSGE